MTIINTLSIVDSSVNSAVNKAQVHKFGGTSLANASRFKAVVDLVLKQSSQQPSWLVVSAPADTTDDLLTIIGLHNQADCLTEIFNLQQKLTRLIIGCLPTERAKLVIAQVKVWLQQIPTLLNSQQSNDVLAIGENVSALLLSQLLQHKAIATVAIDSRDFLYFDQQQLAYKSSKQHLQRLIKPKSIHVVTGYIAKDLAGNTLTLGRNGSDYSATLLASLIAADSVTIWTDVPAIYSADPRQVSDAKPYSQVNWQQAALLAELGNPVLHPRTLYPLMQTEASLIVRSSFASEELGSAVVKHANAQSFITTLEKMQLISIPLTMALKVATIAQQLQLSLIKFGQTIESQSWLVPALAIKTLLRYLAENNISAVVDSYIYSAVAWLKPSANCRSVSAENYLSQYPVLHRAETAERIIWLLPKTLPYTALNQLHQIVIPAQTAFNQQQQSG